MSRRRPPFRTLRLASPRMEGEDVKVIQRILNDSSPKFVGVHPLKVDGVFGEKTALEVEEMLYRLGHPSPKPAIGTDAFKIVWRWHVGSKQLPEDWRIRRRRRMLLGFKPGHGISWRVWKLLHPGVYAQDDPAGMRMEALITMRTWIGLNEIPNGSNVVPRLADVAENENVDDEFDEMGFPWCAYAVYLALLLAGSKTARQGMVEGKFWPLYTPWITNYAKRGEWGHKLVSWDQARAGDLVMFDWSGGDFVDHVGMFEAQDANTVTTIDGNIHNSVGRHVRNKASAPYVIRVTG